MVLYKSFIQLYNVIGHNSLPPWDIGYGDFIVPRAKTYVYLIEFAKLIIRYRSMKGDIQSGRKNALGEMEDGTVKRSNESVIFL